MNSTPLHSANNSTLNLVKTENGYPGGGGGGGGGYNGYKGGGYLQHQGSQQQRKGSGHSRYSVGGGGHTWADYWATTAILAWKNFTRLRRNIP